MPASPRPPLDLPAVIGHRGAAAHAPENTLAGLSAADALGVRWVEVDVHLTRDGVPVLMHDPTLDRTTSGRGHVAHTNVEEISGLDAGSWFGSAFEDEPVPRLDAAVRFAAERGMGLNVELKPVKGRAAPLAEAVLACLDAAWPRPAPAPLLSSFDRAVLSSLGAAGTAYPLGYLTKTLPSGWRDEAEALGCRSVHIQHRNLTQRRADAVKSAGFSLLAYTVNDGKRAATLAEWGVDAVFSDAPDRLLALDGK